MKKADDSGVHCVPHKTRYDMPLWLQNQLNRAFVRKDARNLRMLNDCWFFYRASFAAGGAQSTHDGAVIARESGNSNDSGMPR